MEDEKVIRSSLDVSPPADVSLPDFILNRSKRHEERIALIDGPSGVSYSYRDLEETIRCLSASLWRLGLRKGDRVCLITHNSIEFSVVYFSVMKLGGIVACLNPLFKTHELEIYIDDIKPSFIVATSEILSNISNYVKLHKILQVISISGQEKKNGVLTVESLIGSGRVLVGQMKEAVNIDPMFDPATISYSSGTTGSPKGCVHTHYSFICNVAQMCADDPPVSYLRESADVLLVAVPLYHAYGQMACLLSALYMGATVVLMPRFQLDNYLNIASKVKATVLMCAPPVIASLFARESHPELSSVRVIVSSAAPLADLIVQKVRQKLPQVSLIDEYGMTELMGIFRSPVISTTPYKSRKSGRLAPSVLAKIVDIDSRKSLGPYTEGEIWIKTRCRVKEYWNNPLDTQKYLREDGWFPTGDTGYYDNEYNLCLVERTKDLIKYNGYQVSPSELEVILRTHPAVADVAVVGRRHDVCGELPTAFVVKRSNSLVTEQDICQYIKERVSPQKKLRGGVFFVESIPKSPSGKVQRLVLRNILHQHEKQKRQQQHTNRQITTTDVKKTAKSDIVQSKL